MIDWLIDFVYYSHIYNAMYLHKFVKYTCIQPFRTKKWLLNEYIVI